MCMSDRIKERRMAMGLTQEELGDKLGLQKSAIAKYENGRVENIKRSVILKMADILDCDPGYLLGFRNQPKDSYYFDDATAEKAQELFETPGFSMLFDAARGSRPEDLQMAADLLKRLKEGNPDA